MKSYLLTGLFLALSFFVYSQTPEAFNFQGVARDLSGNPLPNKNIGLRISILVGSSLGQPIYKEKHNIKTSNSGMFSIQIGYGFTEQGTFQNIDWGADSHFVQVELDENGGTNYKIVGTTQLLSVPYALYAKNSGDNIWKKQNSDIYFNDGKVGIGTNTPKTKLQVSNDDIFLSTAAKGVIMKSPDGKCWRLTVNNDGTPKYTSMSCPDVTVHKLTTNPSLLNFSYFDNNKTFTIANEGNSDINWSINQIPAYLTITPGSGTVKVGENVVITVAVDRSKLTTALTNGTFSINYDLGSTISFPVQINNFEETKWLINGNIKDAEYDRINDLIVSVLEAPNELIKYNPVTKTFSKLNLNLPPNCVSISKDGKFAAVGHNGKVSFINLGSMTVLNVFDVTANAIDIILAPNNFAYVFPKTDQWETVRCINLQTGIETKSTGNSIYAGTLARLHPSGNYIYGADNGLSPADIEKYDIRNGTLIFMYDSPYHGDYPMGGNIWFSELGDRIYARSRNVFRASENKDLDITYNGQLAGTGNVISLDHHEGSKRIYCSLSTGNAWEFIPSNTITVYESEFLNPIGSKELQGFIFPDGQGGGKFFKSRAYFVFASSDGNKVHTLVKSEPGSGSLNEWAIISLDK
ncbi:MAG: hypothetical protein IPN86_20255 [Saprospiraceae bacterium]|nr:hypothetical protein [Saprospiraceae bacterium]